MIPARSLECGRLPDLSSMVIAEADQIDRGLAVVATSVPLAEDLVVEILAEDLDGEIVLVLVENGPSEPLFERTARALLEYRRTAALLARLYPNGSFDSRETPRVILAASRFSQQLQDLFALLKIPRLTLLEGAVSDGAGGFHLVITRIEHLRGDSDGAARSIRSGERAGAAHTGNGLGAAEPDEVRTTAPPDDRPAESLQPGTNGNGRCPSLVDNMKQRLLRMSPDVVEEEDGDLVYFRVAGHLLATVRGDQGRLLVTPGGDQAEPIQVQDDAGVSGAMDAVFDCFFGMSPTRRRIAAADRRAGRHARGRECEGSESEAEAASG